MSHTASHVAPVLKALSPVVVDNLTDDSKWSRISHSWPVCASPIKRLVNANHVPLQVVRVACTILAGRPTYVILKIPSTSGHCSWKLTGACIPKNAERYHRLFTVYIPFVSCRSSILFKQIGFKSGARNSQLTEGSSRSSVPRLNRKLGSSIGSSRKSGLY